MNKSLHMQKHAFILNLLYCKPDERYLTLDVLCDVLEEADVLAVGQVVAKLHLLCKDTGA